MTEAVLNHEQKYKKLIAEAYIDPIRTVVVVDDAFPSLDRLIHNKLHPDHATQEPAKENFEKVMEILRLCREQDEPWLVDIHDGKGVALDKEEKIAPHLHHSDLMILDYHLDGDGGTGDKAIGILRRIACNNHYNLVIVYTNGYPDGVSSRQIVSEIGMGLTKPINVSITEADEEVIDQIMEDWEDEENGITGQLLDEISSDFYLRIRNQNDGNFKSIVSLPETARIRELVARSPHAAGLSRQPMLGHFMNWLIKQWQVEHGDIFTNTEIGSLEYFYTEDKNWVRTDQLFVTVVSKRAHQPAELKDKLLDALYSWKPSPHHLLMTKLRSEIDNKGIIGESAVLNNKFVLTGWLQDLMDHQVKDQVKLVKKTFARHWDALGDRIQPNTERFATNLVAALRDETIENLYETFGLTKASRNKNDVLKWTNYFVSNKPLDRSHLTTGHILKIEERGTIEYWACLSPACDLVPGQKKSAVGEKFVPFMAAKLHGISIENALKKANENIFLFLSINDDVACFSLHKDGDQKTPPVSEQMFADSYGIFSPVKCELKLIRAVQSDIKTATNLGISAKEFTAQIIAQLRYEYALNLLQRLGGSLSRIGLDFKSNGN